MKVTKDIKHNPGYKIRTLLSSPLDLLLVWYTNTLYDGTVKTNEVKECADVERKKKDAADALRVKFRREQSSCDSGEGLIPFLRSYAPKSCSFAVLCLPGGTRVPAGRFEINRD